MDDQNVEHSWTEDAGLEKQDVQKVGGNAVAIVGIIAAAFVLLVCILACAVVAYAFIASGSAF